MWWWVLAAGTANAACPDLEATVDAAWAAFDDAEVDKARELVVQANGALLCLPRAAETSELLELYRLEGLVSLAQMDRKGAVYATIRAVVADPEAPPPEDYGPELSTLYALWSERMAGTTGTIRVSGTDQVVIDGHVATGSVEVLQGEHLIQIRDAAGWRGEVVEVGLSHDVVTSGGSVSRPDVGVAPPGLDEPAPLPTEPAPAPSKTGGSGKGRRVALLTISGAAIAGGAVVGGLGFAREGAFADNAFDGPEYGGCGRETPCYDEARAGAIESEARAINALYAASYGLVGVGLTLGVIELVALPAPTAAAPTLGIRGRW